jgi:hypothetical protein
MRSPTEEHSDGPEECNTLVWLCWVSLCSAPQCWASPCSAPQCCTRSQHSSAQHRLTPPSPQRTEPKAWRLSDIHDRGPGKCSTSVWLCWASLCLAPQCCTRSQLSSAQHWLTPPSSQRMKSKSMATKRHACRWSSRVRHLGVAVLGVAVLGTAVLGAAVVGTAVLHPQPAFVRAALAHTPLSTSHSNQNHDFLATSISYGPGKCSTSVWLCWMSPCSAPQCWMSLCSASRCCTRSQLSSTQHWLTHSNQKHGV